MPIPILVETCLENGLKTEAEINLALRGHAKNDKVEAIISLIECHIANHHTDAENRRDGRDEACGAARALKALRSEINEIVSSPPK